MRWRLAVKYLAVTASVGPALLALASCSLTTSLSDLSGGIPSPDASSPDRASDDASLPSPEPDGSAAACDVSRQASCGRCGRACSEGAACSNGACEGRLLATVTSAVRMIVVGDGSAAWAASENELATCALGTSPAGVALVPTPLVDTQRITLRALGRKGVTTVAVGSFFGTEGWAGVHEAPAAAFASRGGYGPVPVSVVAVGATPLIVVALVDPTSGARLLRGCPLGAACGNLSMQWSDLGTTDLNAAQLAAAEETLLVLGSTGPSVGALDACISSACSTTKVRLLDGIPSPSALAAGSGRAYVGTTSGAVISVDIGTKQRRDVLDVGVPVRQLAVTSTVLYVLDAQRHLIGCRLSPSGACELAQRYPLTQDAVDVFAADDVDVVAVTAQGAVLRLTP